MVEEIVTPLAFSEESRAHRWRGSGVPEVDIPTAPQTGPILAPAHANYEYDDCRHPLTLASSFTSLQSLHPNMKNAQVFMNYYMSKYFTEFSQLVKSTLRVCISRTE
ncbi:uncharacterized protein LOC119459564 [Dermacentor silvarum]|uniref:uncharacterized protein LOC119459564 n=1 Tax=Dermacentor silvarum TaxID=543639 RepID=UPI00210088B7|nr:uncharacterized protein LOC119459564 [Dermacentor silvarum]